MRAREAKSKEGLRVIYRDVLEDDQAMADMLKLTQGTREVPVMVEAGKITIGFGGT